MGRSSKDNRTVIRKLTKAVSTFVHAEKSLSPADALELDFRASLRLIPRGIGSAIDARLFGAIDKHRQKKIAETIAYLVSKVNALEDRQITLIDSEFFFSDEFACLFRDCWLKILTTAQRHKLQALRGSLLSIIVGEPSFTFDMKTFFIKSLEVIDDPHIQVLRILQKRYGSAGKKAYYELQELFRTMGNRTESGRSVVHSAVDVLANRRFVEHGNVPQDQEGAIIYEKQRFRMTALGADFLSFIRTDDMPIA